jgi:hypothetical protein
MMMAAATSFTVIVTCLQKGLLDIESAIKDKIMHKN